MSTTFQEIITELSSYSSNISAIISLASALRMSSLHFHSDILCDLVSEKFKLNEQQTFDITFENSINSYYLNKIVFGMECCEKLILNRKTSPSHHNTTVGNQKFYTQAIPMVRDYILDFERPIIEGSYYRWMLFNPSIVHLPGDNGYYAIGRTSNYIVENGAYIPVSISGIVHTRNYLLRLDENFQISWKKEIVDRLEYNSLAGKDGKHLATSTQKHSVFSNQRYPSRITGMEDCRLFVVSDKYLSFTTTTFDNHPYGTPQISLAVLPENFTESNNEEIEIVSLTPLRAPTEEVVCEKNWLPFQLDGRSLAIYNYNPLTIIDITEKQTAITHDSIPSINSSRFRGSAGPIPYKDGYLVLVHEAIISGTRTYLHRWIYLDNEFSILSLSQPFYFYSLGIEYAAGLCWSICGNYLIVTLGLADKEAKIVILDPETLRITGLN